MRLVLFPAVAMPVAGMVAMATAAALTLAPLSVRAQDAAPPAPEQGGETTARVLTATDYAHDAAELDRQIAAVYAYPERFTDGVPPHSAVLDAERDAVRDRDSLLRYAERRLASLADHHAITGSSLADSWAVVPSYADLWVEPDGAEYRITAVRADSPAERAGIVAGDRLVAVGGVPVARAVAGFWGDLGLDAAGDDRRGYAARVLAAGRRDRPRMFTIRHADGRRRSVTLPNLYAAQGRPQPRIDLTVEPDGATIRFNDSLGDNRAIATFDGAMSFAGERPVTIDLRDMPGGGNSVVARAVLGWFVDRPTSYQVHRLPAEERETGIARQWIEQVLPREGMHHALPVRVLVGRWTGSMGEGMAIGLAAMGVPVVGDRMAGLRGAIYDIRLPASGLVVKLPAERLMAVDGTPREDFVPAHP